MRSVGAQDKVLVELIANDRRDAAVAYIENWGGEARRFPTRATPEGIRIELPLTEGLPDDVNILSDRQLELVSRLMRAAWDDDGLALSGWSYIRNIDLDANPPELSVELVSADGATRATLVDRAVRRAAARPLRRPLALQLPSRRVAGSDPGARDPGRRRPGLVPRGHHDRGRRAAHLADPGPVGGRLRRRWPSRTSRTAGSSGRVMRGNERQAVVRALHAPAYAVSTEVDAHNLATVVFRAPAPGRVVVHHVDSVRRELVSAEPEPTDVEGEWQVTLDLSSLPSAAPTATTQGAIGRPLRGPDAAGRR